MDQFILGISAFYHDSAAAILKNGEILAAAQEERFSRIKHDANFPMQAVNYCLNSAGISPDQISAVVYYEKPWTKFERLVENYLAVAPLGFKSFMTALPVWLSDKLWIRHSIDKNLSNYQGELLFARHHEAHAASAFYPSPFDNSAILTLDGVGEWHSTTWGIGEGNKLELKNKIDYPHSLGLLYSAFTYYTGFKVNSGEYKVMGLAPYGEPKYVQTILDNLIDLKEDGSYRLNMKYFDFHKGLRMTGRKFHNLFGGPPRAPESKLTQKEMDLACSIQEVINESLLRLGRHIKKESGQNNLCLAGGVALNCVANGILQAEGIFDKIWIQPAAGDAGGALGAAQFAYHQLMGHPRTPLKSLDRQKGSRLGPSFKDDEIRHQLDKQGAIFKYLENEQLWTLCAKWLDEGKVIGWFQGPMEFGPRALGGRSILGDPRRSDTQSTMNLKIKYRESFRPFAPSILAEFVSDYFETDSFSPYMLLVHPLKKDRCLEMGPDQKDLFGIDQINLVRSDLPAITHVDFSARVQTVHQDTSPKYHSLISEFKRKTGCPVIVNTSFNVRGEPIVNTPSDAFRCFMRTEMDILVIENFVCIKDKQENWKEKGDWREEFQLD